MRLPIHLNEASPSRRIDYFALPSLLVGILLAGCASTNQPPPETLAGKPGAAHRLYVVKCARCHKFYDPAKYSNEEWSKWMRKMSKKAKLTREQEMTLGAYIEETFRHSLKTNPNPGAVNSSQ